MRILSKPTRLAAMTLFAVAITPSAPSGAEGNPVKMDYFRLWNGCDPVGLNVLISLREARALDLRKNRVEAAVRSRLRSARIYRKSAAGAYLNVTIMVNGPAAFVAFDFFKTVDQVFPAHVWGKWRPGQSKKGDWKGYAITWDRSSLGIVNGATEESIISAVSVHTDSFIDEYLRVNAEACN